MLDTARNRTPPGQQHMLGNPGNVGQAHSIPDQIFMVVQTGLHARKHGLEQFNRCIDFFLGKAVEAFLVELHQILVRLDLRVSRHVRALFRGAAGGSINIGLDRLHVYS